MLSPERSMVFLIRGLEIAFLFGMVILETIVRLAREALAKIKGDGK